jgi:hypothetical protein
MLFSVVFLFAFMSHAQAAQLMVTFCGKVSANEASGASGYFQLNFLEGMSQYGYHLDLSNFDFDGAGVDSCGSAGLTWHLHTYWTEEAQSAAGAQCSQAGGHYDPNL